MKLKADGIRPEAYEEWSALCRALAEECDGLPAAASEFAVSVGDKLVDIADTIDKTQDPTERQRQAITNMERGIAKWRR